MPARVISRPTIYLGQASSASPLVCCGTAEAGVIAAANPCSSCRPIDSRWSALVAGRVIQALGGDSSPGVFGLFGGFAFRQASPYRRGPSHASLVPLAKRFLDPFRY